MKKKGFTLIELLAVLVVLAILALITIPLVIGIIKNARVKSNERSIVNYGRAVENAVGVYLLNNPNEQSTTISLTSLDIQTSGQTVTCDNANVIINSNGSIRLESCYVEGTEQKYNYENKRLEKISNSNQTISYTAYNVGDEIIVANEYYYVIADSSTTDDHVVALKQTALTYDEVTSAAEDLDINVQNNDGFGLIPFGGSANYQQSKIKTVVDNWANATFNNNELANIDGNSARLVTIEEIDAESDEICSSGNCLNGLRTPHPWAVISVWYWTMSIRSDNSLWRVDEDGFIYDSNYNTLKLAVRPVINVYKSALQS